MQVLVYGLTCALLAIACASALWRGRWRVILVLLAVSLGAEAGTAAWLLTVPAPDAPDAALKPSADPAYATPWAPSGAPVLSVPLEIVDRSKLPRTGSSTPRVLFLGDSFTAGAGVRRDQAYPAVTGRLLATRGVQAEIVNHAVAGYTTFDEYTLFSAWSAAFDPDIVVIGVLINDLDRLGFSCAAGDVTLDQLMNPSAPWSPMPPLSLSALRHVAALRSATRQTEASYRKAWGDAELTDAFGARLQEIVRRATAGGARVIVARLPLLHELDDDVFAYQADVVRAKAAAAGATYLDLFPAVQGLDASKHWVASFDHHPDAFVQARFAAPVADAIASLMGPPSPSVSLLPEPRALLLTSAALREPAASPPECKKRPGVSLTLAQIALANRDLVPEAERDGFTAEALVLSQFPATQCLP